MTKYEVIRQTVREMDLPEYRYDQAVSAIFKQRAACYSDMRVLPTALRNALSDRLGDSVLTVAPKTVKRSGQAEKLLFGLSDGGRIEAVGLRYKKGWRSYCISSQCGCACGCKFCATGAAGFARSLTADEMTDQLLWFRMRGDPLDSVSFMGMGEPLLSPELFDALATLTDPKLFGLSQRRITVSTVGVVPAIERMTREFPSVNLAFSLHAPTDAQRTELMPVNAKYPLGQTLDALKEHVLTTHRRVFLAYIMLERVNDTAEHAKALAALLRRYKSCLPLWHVDLIPYNATECAPFRPSDRDTIRAFSERLARIGISVAVRSQFGSDIDAACGQLAARE